MVIRAKRTEVKYDYMAHSEQKVQFLLLLYSYPQDYPNFLNLHNQKTFLLALMPYI